MKIRTRQIFHKELFFEYLRQMKSVFMIYAIALLIEVLLVPMGFLILTIREEVGISIYLQPLLVGVALYMQKTLHNLYAYMNHRSGSDFYHALPITRSCQYITALAATFAAGAVLLIVPTALLCLITLCMKWAVISIHVSQLFGIYLLGIFLCSAQMLARSLSGNRTNSVILLYMILLAPRTLVFSILSLIQTVNGYRLIARSGNLFLDYHNNIFINLENSIFYRFAMDSERLPLEPTAGCIVMTLLTSAVYLILAFFLMRHFPSERAEKASISSRWQNAFGVMLTYLFCLIPISQIIMQIASKSTDDMDAMMPFYLIMYVTAVFVFLIYQMICLGRWKAVWKTAKGLIVLVLLNVGTILFVLAMAKIYSIHVPKEADIQYVQFENQDYNNGIRYAGNWVLFHEVNDIYTNEIAQMHFDGPEIKSAIAEAISESREMAEDGYDITDGKDFICTVSEGHGGTEQYFITVSEEWYRELAKLMWAEIREDQDKQKQLKYVELDMLYESNVYCEETGKRLACLEKSELFIALNKDLDEMSAEEWLMCLDPSSTRDYCIETYSGGCIYLSAERTPHACELISQANPYDWWGVESYE